MNPVEARLYDKLAGGRVQCHLCAHECVLAPGAAGLCCVRENHAGILRTLVYGRLIARQVDPIEKKPLYHFQPGSLAYSVAAPGCNFRCAWCQNSDISQLPRAQHVVPGRAVSALDLAAAAQAAGCRSIAYTYTEPTLLFEYACEAARAARALGLKNVFVTNGYMTDRMLEAMHPLLDATNVDLKSFRDETYRRHMGARLAPVLASLKTMRRLGIWVEVTTLVIPGVNDDPAELQDIARFIAAELGPEVPWHLSRFHPSYQMMDAPPTPLDMLKAAEEWGRAAGLRHIYLGNVAGESNTRCPACGADVIRRTYFQVTANRVQPGNRCPDCGAIVAGVELAPFSAG